MVEHQVAIGLHLQASALVLDKLPSGQKELSGVENGLTRNIRIAVPERKAGSVVYHEIPIDLEPKLASAGSGSSRSPLGLGELVVDDEVSVGLKVCVARGSGPRGVTVPKGAAHHGVRDAE